MWELDFLPTARTALHRAALRRHPVRPSSWASPTVARPPRAAQSSPRALTRICSTRQPQWQQTQLQMRVDSQVCIGIRATTCSNTAAVQQPPVQVVEHHSTVRHDQRGRQHSCTLNMSAHDCVLQRQIVSLHRRRIPMQSRGWPAARRARSWSSTQLARDLLAPGAIVHFHGAHSALVMSSRAREVGMPLL